MPRQLTVLSARTHCRPSRPWRALSLSLSRPRACTHENTGARARPHTAPARPDRSATRATPSLTGLMPVCHRSPRSCPCLPAAKAPRCLPPNRPRAARHKEAPSPAPLAENPMQPHPRARVPREADRVPRGPIHWPPPAVFEGGFFMLG